VGGVCLSGAVVFLFGCLGGGLFISSDWGGVGWRNLEEV